MRIKIKKNRIIPIVIVFIVLLTIIFLWILHKSKGLNYSDLKYVQMLNDNCQISEQNNNAVIFQCKGIVFDYSFPNKENGKNEECFGISVISESYFLQDYKICEEIGIVDFDKSVFVNEKYGVPSDLGVPLTFTVEYSRDILGKAKLNGITFIPMSDEEINDLQKDFFQYGRSFPKVRTQQYIEILEKGYYHMPYSRTEFFKEFRLGQVNFYLSEIKEINIENGKVFINFSLEINGKNYDMQILRENIEYIGPESFNVIDIDANNYGANLYPQLKVQVTFWYLPISIVEGGESGNLERDCNLGGNDIKVPWVCDFLENTTLRDVAIGNVDDYINNVIDDLEEGEMLNFSRLIFNKLIFR